MAKRKPISKGKRFDVFRRDAFTCQYCGRQPPETILHIDHVVPVVGGGTNDESNLVTACESCNIGKGTRPAQPVGKPDADLRWLEVQQERLELERYVVAKQERDGALDNAVGALQDHWLMITGLDWAPGDDLLRAAVERCGPSMVEEALSVTGRKLVTRRVSGYDGNWAKYFHGVLRSMREQREGLDEDGGE